MESHEVTFHSSGCLLPPAQITSTTRRDNPYTPQRIISTTRIPYLNTSQKISERPKGDIVSYLHISTHILLGYNIHQTFVIFHHIVSNG